MDSNLEGKVKECHPCQINRKAPPNAPLHPWIWPNRPWSLAYRSCGAFYGQIISRGSRCTLQMVGSENRTFNKLTGNHSCTPFNFAIHGLPDIIVSDNGTAFTSSEFNDFLQKNGIKSMV